MEDSIIQRGAKKAKRHKKKLGATFTLAGLITGLQVYGVLAPMFCHLPFIHDTQSCVESGRRAAEAAHSLGQLDNMVLDAGVLP